MRQVGFRLYREVRDFAPAEWTQSEFLTALMIADDANDDSRESWIAHTMLKLRTRLSDRGLRNALQGLADSGYEFRVIHGYGKDGRPVYAARSHATDYRVPDMVKGGTLMPPMGPGKGGTVMPPNSETDKKGGTVLPKGGTGRSKGGTVVPPLSSISSASPQRTVVPVITTSVEGNGHRPPTLGEIEAWRQANESRWQRENGAANA